MTVRVAAIANVIKFLIAEYPAIIFAAAKYDCAKFASQASP